MIVYFADRELNILGHASTELKQGLRIRDDKKTEETETGVAIFECKIEFDDKTRTDAEEWAEVGNYVLRKHKDDNELYTIIDSELDVKKQTLYIYAEDDGMDLLNEVVEEYEADTVHTIEYYVKKYAESEGFVIGINEDKGTTLKLSFDNEQTKTARINAIAAQFGMEISFSFKVNGLNVVERYINLYRKRGKDNGTTLYLGKEIDNIVISKTISNLATALKVTGDKPEGEDDPITLKGYSYDDGDIYIDSSGILKSRKALARWKRYLWKTEVDFQEGGHITKTFTYKTTDKATLCSKAVAELKLLCDAEVNYDAEIKSLPDNVEIGDRVNIVDDKGELYLSTRFLKHIESVVDQTHKATLGEHLIKSSGIHQKVLDLAEKFASSSASAERAYKYAVAAQTAAINAQTTADSALEKAEAVQDVADQASAAATKAQESATKASQAADNAQALVESVEESVVGMEDAVNNANEAAAAAQQAAANVESKVQEAKQAADNAAAKADQVAVSLDTSLSNSQSALSKATEAETVADDALTKANAAETTANAAKLDSEAAKKDIASLSENLTTLSNTMSADYTRKTELTETEAKLQTQISQNAAGLSSHAESLVRIDETTNNAAALAAASYFSVAEAQALAQQTAIEAEQAQEAATRATLAAEQAQAEADTATAAANEAQSILDTANADLQAAQKRLDEVMADEESTEAEIAEAQTAVNTAQAAAAKAQTDAEKAIEDATTAQQAATDAQEQAKAAQQTAFTAVQYANIAQLAAQEAEGSAANKAKETADQAKSDAESAQSTANEAKTKADTAQAQANAAAQTASTAQQAALDADNKVKQAQADLDTAKANLESVTSRVGATEEEIAAAQEAVNTAQAKANQAKADAEAAQATAQTAKENAEAAQNAADTAKQAADKAKEDADAAKQAADNAQAAVAVLAIRVTQTETDIVQTNEHIALLATKEEVTTTLGGYYTKAETDAAISVKADEINLSVDSKIEEMQIGGRNLLLGTAESVTETSPSDHEYQYHTYAITLLPLLDTSPYTISADVEVLTGDVTQISVKLYDSALQTQYRELILDIENGHIEGTFANVDSASEVLLLYAGVAGSTAGNSVTFSKVKFEKGNKATDWTEAPEDVDDDVNTAQSTADNALSGLAEAQAQIQILADSIAQLVRDGNGGSLVKQDSNGFYYFDISEIDTNISDTASNLNDLEGIVTDLNGQIDILKSTAEALQSRTEYVKSYTDENDQPCLELGEGDSKYKAFITNTSIILTDGTTNPVEITQEGMATKKVTTDAVQMGVFLWVVDENGHLVLTEKESEE